MVRSHHLWFRLLLLLREPGLLIQGAAERTPRFGRVIASGRERAQWWGARHRITVYVPFSVYTMVWLGEHRAFIVEEFIKNGG